jgi:hypothetical protein
MYSEKTHLAVRRAETPAQAPGTEATEAPANVAVRLGIPCLDREPGRQAKLQVARPLLRLTETP